MDERLPGLRAHRQQDGQTLWIIERQIHGRRYHISTHTHSLRAALEQLRKFEADPEAYAAAAQGTESAASRPLVLTGELVLEYRGWLLQRPRPATLKHANEMAHRLEEWVGDLGGRDLRRLQLADLKALADGRSTCRQHRIIAIKGLCAWLRQEKFLLDRRTDPSLDLQVPQAVPEKHRRRKAVPVDVVRAALAHLAPPYRDCLLVLGTTGWHVTELERFARAEESRIAPGRGDVLAVLQVLHKTGATTRTPLRDPAALAAAERLRARRQLPRRLNATIRAACLAAGVAPFSAGVLRHSVATWAVEEGALPELVAEFLGHHDKRTTTRFYTDVAVPTAAPPLPRLL